MRLSLPFIFLFILASPPPAARAQESEVLNNESIRKMKERRQHGKASGDFAGIKRGFCAR